MNDQMWAEIKRLKNDAKLLRDIGEADRATAALDKAIATLDVVPSQPQTPIESERIRAELADCWGMKGGIFRRAGRLADALAAYKTGLHFESGNSYNLTNSIVLELLINCSELEELKANIAAARDEVRRQVESYRSSQWWAWADLGLLELLCGREDQALDAYKHFATTGARASDYDSTISVLEELSAKCNQPLRASLQRAGSLLKRLKS